MEKVDITSHNTESRWKDIDLHVYVNPRHALPPHVSDQTGYGGEYKQSKNYSRRPTTRLVDCLSL